MQKTSPFQKRAETATAELTATKANDKASMIQAELNALESLTETLKNLANNVQTDLENGLANTQETSDQVKALQEQMSLLSQSVATLQSMSNETAQHAQASLHSLQTTQANIHNHQASLAKAHSQIDDQAIETIQQLDQATATIKQHSETILSKQIDLAKAWATYYTKRNWITGAIWGVLILPFIIMLCVNSYLYNKGEKIRKAMIDHQTADELFFKRASTYSNMWESNGYKYFSHQMLFTNTDGNRITLKCKPQGEHSSLLTLTFQQPLPKK